MVSRGFWKKLFGAGRGRSEKLLRNYLELGLSFEEISDNERFGKSYCGSCGTRHAKRWLTLRDYEADFYLCRVGDLSVVVREDEGEFHWMWPKEFIAAYPIGDSEGEDWSTEQAIGFRLGELAKRVARCVEVELTLTPPWMAIKVSPGNALD